LFNCSKLLKLFQKTLHIGLLRRFLQVITIGSSIMIIHKISVYSEVTYHKYYPICN